MAPRDINRKAVPTHQGGFTTKTKTANQTSKMTVTDETRTQRCKSIKRMMDKANNQTIIQNRRQIDKLAKRQKELQAMHLQNLNVRRDLVHSNSRARDKNASNKRATTTNTNISNQYSPVTMCCQATSDNDDSRSDVDVQPYSHANFRHPPPPDSAPRRLEVLLPQCLAEVTARAPPDPVDFMSSWLRAALANEHLRLASIEHMRDEVDMRKSIAEDEQREREETNLRKRALVNQGIRRREPKRDPRDIARERLLGNFSDRTRDIPRFQLKEKERKLEYLKPGLKIVPNPRKALPEIQSSVSILEDDAEEHDEENSQGVSSLDEEFEHQDFRIRTSESIGGSIGGRSPIQSEFETQVEPKNNLDGDTKFSSNTIETILVNDKITLLDRMAAYNRKLDNITETDDHLVDGSNSVMFSALEAHVENACSFTSLIGQNAFEDEDENAEDKLKIIEAANEKFLILEDQLQGLITKFQLEEGMVINSYSDISQTDEIENKIFVKTFSKENNTFRENKLMVKTMGSSFQTRLSFREKEDVFLTVPKENYKKVKTPRKEKSALKENKLLDEGPPLKENKLLDEDSPFIENTLLDEESPLKVKKIFDRESSLKDKEERFQTTSKENLTVVNTVSDVNNALKESKLLVETSGTTLKEKASSSMHVQESKMIDSKQRAELLASLYGYIISVRNARKKLMTWSCYFQEEDLRSKAMKEERDKKERERIRSTKFGDVEKIKSVIESLKDDKNQSNMSNNRSRLLRSKGDESYIGPVVEEGFRIAFCHPVLGKLGGASDREEQFSPNKAAAKNAHSYTQGLYTGTWTD